MKIWQIYHILGVLLVSGSLSATTIEPPNPDDDKIGYFWYKEAPIQQERKELAVTAPSMPTHDAMMAMHPKDFRILLKHHREYAIQTMQPMDVLNYQKVQDVARRKADAFAAVSSLVLLQNPQLNAQSAVPTTNPGMAAQRKQVDHSIASTLQRSRAQFALGLFTMPNCGHCQVQKQTLMQFHQRHGWRIKEIDVMAHRQLVDKFNIQVTPTLVLIKNDTPDWMPISVGVEALSTIEQNVYRGVRLLRGEIQPQQFFMDSHERGGFSDPLSGGR